MLKRLLLLLAVIIVPISISAKIVNNSGNSAADSISIPFFALDSVGNSTGLTTNDSLYLVTYYPNGSPAFRDTIAFNNALIDTVKFSGDIYYNWNLAVADIDGTGKDGVYSYILAVHDNTGAALTTLLRGTFQVYQSSDFNTYADSTMTALARLDNINDSLQAVIDTLQNQDNWVATTNNQISLSLDHVSIINKESDIEDTTNAIIDSLQSGFGVSAGSIASIVDATWDELQSEHIIAGSFGRYLDAEISGLSSGSGAYSFQIVVFDSSSSQVVPGASMALRNIDQTALIGSGRTNSSGVTTFNLDADNYSVVVTSPGYLFQPFDTIAVVGAGVDTVMGYPFDPGNPVSPSLCRVWGSLHNLSGEAMADGEVTASLPAGVTRQGSLVISPFQVSTSTDSTGYFFLDLIPSDSLVPAGSLYEITLVTSNGTVLRKRLTVPDGTSWQLSW